ncbi:MAG: 1-(5-phosphoribosyl)-5-[(5-phosphoribosylamino)methylideneamino]imidazole-4-carboxamide isomerase [candidate division NC10 bacterium RBG_16_65_8]|nr:MAG: 1-(5-phosphoribosyl)-5-[(5-phosphoribosylamino)methylideneamino]imidazole-4-carboxamide isomerase [candidate division NC10 bacterium RBG_16_65_8]
MEIIPAIDLRGGKVVRLVQGDPARETRYGDDPAAVAAEWERRGAPRLHLVDLDGALGGSPANQQALGEILRRVRVPAEVGGGLRSLDAVRAILDLGAAVAVLGTAAIRDPGFLEAACAAFPARVALGLDARGGILAISGWAEATSIRATDLARQTSHLPLHAIIYTDIQRDGMLEGPNLSELGAVAAATRIPVIASGGISSVEDLRALRAMEPARVTGAIVGKALYDGRLTLEAALAVGRS